MIHALDNSVTPARPMVAIFARLTTPIAAILSATHAALRKVETAHAARCHRAAFSAQEARDSGLDASDATRIASWQPDLPFFMQSGFGRK